MPPGTTRSGTGSARTGYSWLPTAVSIGGGPAPGRPTSTTCPLSKKFIPEPFEIYAAVHSYDGSRLGIIHIPRGKEGFCIFAVDGQYRHPTESRDVIVFREAHLHP